MKFGQLILSKIIKIVATSRQTLRPKCTKFDFGWGSAPDPARGAHSAHGAVEGTREGKERRNWRGGGREGKGRSDGGRSKGVGKRRKREMGESRPRGHF